MNRPEVARRGSILVLNPGSSSLRFQVVLLVAHGKGVESRRIGGGSIASIGSKATLRTRVGSSELRVEPTDARDHVAALDRALEWVESQNLDCDAVGVRLVHVGGGLGEARLVDPEFLDVLRKLSELAPLHTGAALALIERTEARFEGSFPIAAVSDSAFHMHLPRVAREYALPAEWTARFGLRRFGYHGLAVQSVTEKFRAEHPDAGRLVVAHLGSGCSVTAVRDGISIDTSMGFSPLEGMPMATRSGSVDPTIVAQLCRELGAGPEEIVRQLNLRSGLLGVSGRSGDMREIEALRRDGDHAAGLAFDLFAYRARSHMVSAMAALEGADAVLFSGGIGENSPAVREAVLAGMAWCGIEIDPRRNSEASRHGGRISADAARIGVYVVGVDEEQGIARATVQLLQDAGRAALSTSHVPRSVEEQA